MPDVNKNRPSRILIVDDEPLIRKIIVKYLSDKNYITETAADGAGALEKLAADDYDLVLTDLRMPKMGGTELLQTMSEKYPKIPKIILTGYGTTEDIILALKTGAYDFLTKPITDFKILEHSIERALERKRLSDDKNRFFAQLQQINEIISMLNIGKSTEDIFNLLNVSLKKIIPFNRLALATIQKDEDAISTKLIASDRVVLLGAGETSNIFDSSLKNIMQNKEALNIPNLEDYLKIHPNSRSASLLIKEGMASSLVIPLIVNNNLRGFLMFASVQKEAFTEEHLNFLQSIVGQISLSIQRGELMYEIEQHTKNLEGLVELRSRQILKTQKTTVFALSKLAETRDPETGDHLERIRNYSVLLAQILKYSGHTEITNQYLRDLYDSSILHDIGKVGIPDGVLLKDGFLTKSEFDLMKTHTTIGYEALKSASRDLGTDLFLNMSMDVTLYHHERWDGKGYPKGLKEDQIPLSARIVSIADIYDALNSKRPYKEAFTHEKSIEIMKEEFYRFEPDLFKVFLDNAEEFEKIKKRYAEIMEI